MKMLPVHRLLYSIACATAITLSAFTNEIARATDPPTAAFVHYMNGRELFMREGSRGRTVPARVFDRIQNNRFLIVSGTRSWANLGFYTVRSIRTDLLVQAGPGASQWFFPCGGRGDFKVGWGRGSSRGCQQGVSAEQLPIRINHVPNPIADSLALLKQVVPDGMPFPRPGGGWYPARPLLSPRVLIIPATENPTIAQTQTSANGYEILAIQNDLIVRSVRSPNGQLIAEGQRYNVTRNTISSFDRDAILQSPAMQDFLNPSVWFAAVESRPNDAPPVITANSSSLNQQLQDHLIAFDEPPF